MKLRNCGCTTTLTLCLLLHSTLVWSVTFPVTNATELLTALHTAANNFSDDTIRIAQGNYSGGFVYSSSNAYNLTIEGGWNNDFTTRSILASNTILDGGNSQRVLGIVGNTAKITVEGVTLRNGNWNVSGTGGGGLYISTSGGDVIVRDCDISNNVSGNAGGGGLLILSAGGEVTLTGNSISDNSSPSSGGGAYIQAGAGSVTLSTNNLSGNTSTSIGGAARIWATGSVRMEANQIFDNVATGGGSGGVYILGPSNTAGASVIVSGNSFSGNSSWMQYNGTLYVQAKEVTVESNSFTNNLIGYGVQLHQPSSSVIWKIFNNFIVDNAQGGGIRLEGYNNFDSVTVINNVISGNSYTRSDGLSGGIDFKWARGKVTLNNNTITYNNTIGTGGGLRLLTDRDDTELQLHSNIIYNNSATIEANNVYIDNDGNNNLIYAPETILNNNFEQNTASFFFKDPTFYIRIDPSNLNGVDPLFTNADGQNFRLQSSSPCINTGNNQAPAIPLIDLDGQPRIMGGGIDMGAYETPEAVLPVALFSANPLSGAAPLVVNFQDDSYGNISSRLWDFGDGNSSTDHQPMHTYTEAGTYTVTLTVTGNEGSDSESKAAFISVLRHPPVASAGSDHSIAQKTFTFNGAASSDPDGSIVTYEWHLAHRSNSAYNQTVTGIAPTVSGLQSGFYDVTLTVTDDDGLTGSDTVVLAVSEPWDISGDGQTGLSEAIHILRTLSGL